MATVSFDMRREIKSDNDAERFIEALEKSKTLIVKKDKKTDIYKEEEESREFLRKVLSR
jgi:hypothetical protein